MQDVYPLSHKLCRLSLRWFEAPQSGIHVSIRRLCRLQHRDNLRFIMGLPRQSITELELSLLALTGAMKESSLFFLIPLVLARKSLLSWVHMRNTFFRKQYIHGFTLVELIVVIVILSLLTLASGTAYIATLRTSRDGRRKIDLENIKQALEAYHSDNSTYPYTENGTIPLSTFLDPPGGKKYITMPKDPKSGQDYYYKEDGCEDINGVQICNSYNLGVILENTPNNIPDDCFKIESCPNPNTGVFEPCNYCLDPYGPFPTPTPIQGGGPGMG